MMNLQHYLWIEKYRPKTIEECILVSELKDYFKGLLEEKEIPNLLLSGNAGCGKTTVARALCEEMNAEYLFINGSEENGIDVLRSTIKNFAMSVSITSKIKVVIIDEADYLSPSFQNGFKAFMEEYSSNCRFILTCNNKNKIIKPLHSRLTNVDFKMANDDKPIIAKQFFKRVLFVLKNEGIEANNDIVAAIIQKYFPDFRKTILELQRNCKDGILSDKILSNSVDVDIEPLVKILKDKDWKAMRTWVCDNISDYDINDLFRKVYDGLIEHTDQAPHLVVLIGEWQYKSSFMVDQEITFTAFLTEVMANVEFK